MNLPGFQINLQAAWLGILLGFFSGMVLGLFFRREDWLGGYASFKRRMYRLAHISFFGLGAVNLFFWLTVKALSVSGPLLAVASWAFVLGAITMPACCVVMAHWPKVHLIFSVPVVSLIAGGVLTLAAVGNHDSPSATSEDGRVTLIAGEIPPNSVSRNPESQRPILPLPAGEGWGEGESLEQNSLSRIPHDTLNPF